jgi:hypothetical protein
MINSQISVVWSNQAKVDLKFIYNRILEKTKSAQNARNVINDIIQKSKDIQFINQYQSDEFLKEPYRRMVVRHYK